MRWCSVGDIERMSALVIIFSQEFAKKVELRVCGDVMPIVHGFHVVREKRMKKLTQ